MSTLKFHLAVIKKIILCASKTKKGQYTYRDIVSDGQKILDMLKNLGCTITISGRENLEELKGPCVFIANHMSTLETLVLPAVVGQDFRLTFVVKSSLLRYPFFGRILQILRPIPVTRENPREDLRIVLTEGVKRLNEGISVVVFPQATRQLVFEPSKFNTLGIKLAKRASVPAVPIALRTDAWAMGKIIKDFGKIDPSKPICFLIGKPVYISDRGHNEHLDIINFIQQSLARCYNY